MSEAAPTRQLYVHFRGRFKPNKNDLEILFGLHGKLKFVWISPQGKSATITYWSFNDAKYALKRLDQSYWKGLTLSISFERASRKLHIDGPRYLMEERKMRVLIEHEFERFGEIDSIDIVSKKNCIYVNYKDVNHANQAVLSLQGKKASLDWNWEIEFHKVFH